MKPRILVSPAGYAVAFAIAAMVCLVGCQGCGQSTTAPVNQTNDQATTTPTTTEQDAATQGSQVNVWVINAPGKQSLPDPGGVTLDSEDGVDALIDSAKGDAGGSADGVGGRYAQAGFSIVINTGSTTPSQTGTTTGTGTAAQNPTTTQTQSPTQENTGSVPVGFAAPGGMVDQQATATGKGTTSDTSKTSENELRWQRLEAMADQLDGLLPILEQFFKTPVETLPDSGGDTATTQPAAG